MKKQKKKRISKVGLAPGTKIYIGQDRTNLPIIEIVSFNQEEIKITKFNELGQNFVPENDMIHWINVDGIHNVELVDEIGKLYGIHSLTIEDILNTFQRPKLDILDDYIFCTLKMINDENDPTNDEQVSLLLVKGAVISFQEQAGDVFDSIRVRLNGSENRIRKKSADFLFFCLIDVIVDKYIDVVDRMGEKISALEHDVAAHPTQMHLAKILDMKSDLLMLRKSLFPLREAIAKVNRNDNNMIEVSNQAYFHDLYDHVIQVIENIDLLRELNDSQRESYHASLSNRMNRVMELLTIVTTIFIPLSFIAGVYGMNFKNMPELNSDNGYFYALTFMGILALGMIYYFKKKKLL